MSIEPDSLSSLALPAARVVAIPSTSRNGANDRLDPRDGDSREKAQSDVYESFEKGKPGVHARRIVAELVGAFFLVFIDCAGAILGSMAPDEVTSPGRALATGLLILALVYSLGNVSGAHFNPSVTLAFALRKAFPWKMVPAYWAAQLVGALLSVGVLSLFFGRTADLGATHPHVGVGVAFLFELVLTSLLVMTVLGTATRHRLIGPNAAFASGAVVALCALFSRPASGASMNPARSLAPALVTGHLHEVWIYLLAPLLGSMLAVGMTALLHPKKHACEQEAAEGE